MGVPYPQAAREAEELQQILAASKKPLTVALLSSLTRARELEERVQASRRGAYLVLYLFDHQRRIGSFPKSLGELKASGLAQLRIDPFSGKDFVYRPSGKDFVLYSVGANLKDDGGRQGKQSSEGDYVYWPVTDEASPKPAGKQGSAGKK